MHVAYIALLGIALGLFIGVAIAFYWAYKNKQFEDIEQAKYEMLEDCTGKTDDEEKMERRRIE